MKVIGIAAATLMLVVVALCLGDGTKSQAAAPSRIYPVVDPSYGFLLGGTSQGKWLTTDVMSNTVAGGEVYRAYSLKGYLGRAAGSGAESAGAPCEDTQIVDLKPSYQDAGAIAVGGTWTAMPRVPKSLSNKQPVYVKAVADLLKAEGIANPKVNIEQILQIDLEGDRVNEVLVSASYFAGSEDNEPMPSAEPGDYSIVFMRKLVRGKVETVVLAEDIQTKKVDFGAPFKFDIAGVLDLNGDGVMEVVLHDRYYEGIGSSVLEMKGTKYEVVLDAGCGA